MNILHVRNEKIATKLNEIVIKLNFLDHISVF